MFRECRQSVDKESHQLRRERNGIPQSATKKILRGRPNNADRRNSTLAFFKQKPKAYRLCWS